MCKTKKAIKYGLKRKIRIGLKLLRRSFNLKHSFSPLKKIIATPMNFDTPFGKFIKECDFTRRYINKDE